jgi:hypothetical protein
MSRVFWIESGATIVPKALAVADTCADAVVAINADATITKESSFFP